MASRQISDEEIQLKKRARHRLIGAIVLVTVAVIVLPLVLDDKPPSVGEEIAIEIPDPQKSGEFTPRIVPIDPRTAKSSATSPSSGPSSAPTQQAVTQEKSAPAPAEVKTQLAQKKPKVATVEKTAAPAKSAAKSTKPPAIVSGQGFVVQLGAFSNVANAQELQGRLKAHGIQSYSEPLKTAQGDKTRVRAGPFASREEAEKALAKLKAMGVNGVVVENKG